MDPARSLRRLPQRTCGSPPRPDVPDVRADVIRQFHERGDDGMVEVLSDLEADDLLRLQVIQRLVRLGAEDR